MKRLSILLILLCFLAGCNEKGIYIENTTAHDEAALKKVLEGNEHVKLAKVLLYEDELLAGIRVNTFSRFQKKTVASDIKKKLKKDYPDMKVTVSADSKVLLETNKLMNKKEQKHFRKKIDKIKSIEKEQT
ncbi:hypothetical protein SporoP37_13555 [Sporosarcina sp. P37]|uniref:hypothetical protein n=1 Tax=unclassified Sporosarcina TaxID=2647733 RepID=UPI000A17E691|nr:MULTISPECIES: hypothetical protein [unclassified Sporosarcina]ARK25578.1 hypothetical protein SporoP37_13555 [Sporosarcina sp. P37]PID17293.1 hypothetical protein CSV62_14200 [Sporosarcina sp. P35]